MNQTNYGNWVPEKLLKMFWGLSAILLAICLLLEYVLHVRILTILVGITFVLSLAMAIYMQICHHAFSFTGGGVMRDIHQLILTKLDWSGEGKLLDIGCGSGALSIRCAKKYPKAAITGMDYWGVEWNYAKKQCEQNAVVEGVEEQTSYQQGDAAKLPFKDETFDAAVSNFVFHEVRTQPNKRLVVREALRVVKKGGSFAFQDMFNNQSLYGDIEQFIEELRQEGMTDIQYEAHTERLPIVPWYCKAPWMLSNMGIIYGRK